jgi:hypothetical protein
VDISTLIQTLTPWIIGAGPYLLRLGETAGEEAAKELAKDASQKLGASVWEIAQKIWNRIFDSQAEAKPDVVKAVKDVTQHPNNDLAKSGLQWQLSKLLEEDKSMADAIRQILEEARSSGVEVIAAGDRSVAIGGDVTDSTIITGDRNITRK